MPNNSTLSTKNHNFWTRWGSRRDQSSTGSTWWSWASKICLVWTWRHGENTNCAIIYLREPPSFPCCALGTRRQPSQIGAKLCRVCLWNGIGRFYTSNQTTSRERLKRWFETAGRLIIVTRRTLSDWTDGFLEVPWLLIFDNADDEQEMNLLDDFRPPGNRGSIFVTTRDKSARGKFTGGIRELQKLEEKDAVNLLIKLSRQRSEPHERKDAANVCARVDCLPCAISTAAFIIHNDSLSFAEYLSVYSNRDLIIESKPLGGPTTQYAHSPTSVWSMNFTWLDKETRFLLNILAFLDPDKIQESLIAEGALKCGDDHLDFIRTPKSSSYIAESWVIVYSSTEIRASNKFGSIVQCKSHVIFELIKLPARLLLILPFVLFIACGQYRNVIIDTSQNFGLFSKTTFRISQAWLSTTGVPKTKTNSTPSSRIHWRPHNNSQNSCIMEHGMITLQSNHDLTDSDRYLYERGDFASASPLLEIAKQHCHRHPENAEVNFADIYGALTSKDSESNNLRSILMNFQSQWEYLQKAFKKRFLERDKSYAREALALAGLGNGYSGVQEYSKAEEFYWKCLEVWKNLPSEPTIYETHLAACHTVQGKLDAAEQVLRNCIDSRAAKYGPLDITSYR